MTPDVVELLIQGSLAFVLLAGMIAVIVFELVRGQAVNIPQELSLAVVAVVSFFYGARSSRTSPAMTQATADVVRASAPAPAPAPDVGDQVADHKGGHLGNP